MGWFKNIFASGAANGRAAPSPASLTSLPALWTPQTWESLVKQMIELPDPYRVLRKLGYDRTELERLMYDDEIYQCVQTREDGLQNVPIRLEPTESQAARFITDRCLGPGMRRTLVRGAFKALLYGWSIMEIVWDEDAYREEGAFVPKDVSERSLRNFAVRPDGTLVQNAASRPLAEAAKIRPELQKAIKDVPGAEHAWVVMDTRYKFLLTRNRPHWENPYGEALLSRLYWPWFFRHNAWQFLGQYLERFAVGIMVGSIDNESEMGVEELAACLMRAQQDATVAVKGGSVSVLNPNASGHELYKNVEEMLVRRIQKVVLGQTLTSGTDGGSGNRALGQVHDEVRMDKVESDAGMALPTIQTYVDACFRLNGFAGTPPEVVFGDEVNLARQRAERDQILLQAGMVGGFSEGYILDNYGFRPGEFTLSAGPRPAPGVEVIEVDGEGPEEGPDDGSDGGGAAVIRPGGPTVPGRTPPARNLNSRGSAPKAGPVKTAAYKPSELALEALSLWAATRAGSPIHGDRIRAAVRESNTAGELVDRLSALQADLRPEFASEMVDACEAALRQGRRDVRARR
jgi:hypothetical protein